MLSKITNWFAAKPHTKAMYITAIATIVMAVMSAIMCKTVTQNKESIRLSAKSILQVQQSIDLSSQLVELSKKEFQLRNRPIIAIKKYSTGGKARDKVGKLYPHNLRLELVNISDIPATKLVSSSKVYINGKEVAKTDTASVPAYLSKASPRYMSIYLNEEVYAAFTNAKDKIEILTDITYSEMLKDNPNKYKTKEKVIYMVPERVFGCIYTHYE